MTCVVQSQIYLYISSKNFFFFVSVPACAHVTEILSHKNMDAVILYSSLRLKVLGIRSGRREEHFEKLEMGLPCVSGSHFCISCCLLTRLWHFFFPVLITSPMRSFTMVGKLSALLVAAGVGAHSFEAHGQQ